MADYNIFTSESVSEGHPDKLADQISDAVLDAILTDDPHARVACETMVKTGVAIVGGEITTSAWVDLEDLVPGQLNANLLSGSFTGTGPEVRTVEVGGDTRVRIDVDGDGTEDMRIVVQGVTGLTEDDFVF